jgi:hypothetical protein
VDESKYAVKQFQLENDVIKGENSLMKRDLAKLKLELEELLANRRLYVEKIQVRNC